MRAHGFRVSFTPLPEVLFTFPSRYSSTVGLPVVFSLAGWSPRFHAGFLVSCATQVAASPRPRVSPTGLSPAMAGVSTPFGYAGAPLIRRLLLPRRARRHAPGLGIVRFRSPLLAESLLFSLPAGTEMFQFPALAPASPVSSRTGFPIRTSADRFAFADPRGFSQLVTSFFASGSLRHPPCALFRFPFYFLLPTLPGLTPRCALATWFASYSRVYTMSMTSPSVVPGRVELPTSTLSV